MKTRNKVLAVIGSMFVIIMAFIIVNQKSQKDEGESVSISDKSHKLDSNDATKVQKKEGGVGNDSDSTPAPESVSNDYEQSGTSANHDENKTSTGEVSESGVASKTETEDEDVKKEVGSSATGEVAGKASETPTKDTKDTESAPSTEEKSEGTSSGLHFSSREEAMAFGFSRFTSEEIALYNKAAERGLTPEQEAMALQIAYSRFTAEEIAAIEEALGR